MPSFPPLTQSAIAETGVVTSASSYMFLVAAHASANTKGAYTEAIASTSEEVTSLRLYYEGGAGANQDSLVDIAIGAAASEVVIVSNLALSRPGSIENGPCWVDIPIHIPAGTRVAVRRQDSTGGGSIVMGLICQTGKALTYGRSFSKAVTYGVNTGDSGGTSIDPGGSANTKGSYVQLTASTTAPIRYLILCLQGQTNAVRTFSRFLIDVAIGAAASEVVLLQDIPAVASGNSDYVVPTWAAFEVSIPAGSRIAVRAQASITDATDRLFDISLVGFS